MLFSVTFDVFGDVGLTTHVFRQSSNDGGEKRHLAARRNARKTGGKIQMKQLSIPDDSKLLQVRNTHSSPVITGDGNERTI